jgi:hypothetical protein
LIVAKELIMSVHRVTSFNNILNSI